MYKKHPRKLLTRRYHHFYHTICVETSWPVKGATGSVVRTQHTAGKNKPKVGPMYDVYLRLSRSRVPQEQHVDVPPDAVFGVDILCAPAKKTQRDRSFHVLAAVDRWRNGADDAPSDLSFDCVRPCDREMQRNTWSAPTAFQRMMCGAGTAGLTRYPDARLHRDIMPPANRRARIHHVVAR